MEESWARPGPVLPASERVSRGPRPCRASCGPRRRSCAGAPARRRPEGARFVPLGRAGRGAGGETGWWWWWWEGSGRVPTFVCGSRGAGAAAAAAVLAGSRCWSILAWGCVCADGNFWRSRCVNAFGTGCCSDAEAQELCVRACTLSIAAAGAAGHCSVPRVDEGPCVALPLTGAARPHPLRSCCRHEF